MMRWPPRRDIGDRNTGDVYMRRWRLVSTPWFGVFVHHILRPDWTLDPHDHPWGFWSWRFLGTYTEHVYSYDATGARPLQHHRHYTGRRVSWRPYGTIHRVHALSRPEGVWSLVVRGRRHPSWGFVTQSGWVHEADYQGGARGAARAGGVG